MYLEFKVFVVLILACSMTIFLACMINVKFFEHRAQANYWYYRTSQGNASQLSYPLPVYLVSPWQLFSAERGVWTYPWELPQSADPSKWLHPLSAWTLGSEVGASSSVSWGLLLYLIALLQSTAIQSFTDFFCVTIAVNSQINGLYITFTNPKNTLVVRLSRLWVYGDLWLWHTDKQTVKFAMYYNSVCSDTQIYAGISPLRFVKCTYTLCFTWEITIIIVM